jgi:L-lactate dehydrogenase complex protein LldG
MTGPKAPDMGEARGAVLGRIRDALADGPAVGPIPRDYERALPPGTDRIELFVERVGDYRATVHRTTQVDLPATVAAVLATHRAARIAVPDGVPDAWLAPAGAPAGGGAAAAPPGGPHDPVLSHADLDRLDGVVTGCAVAIAETGTIVLDAGADQGRRALSLLPDLHVCVVLGDQVVGSVPEAIARLDATRPQTWISGPSATSDIELQRVEGVHGPRRLEVIVVEA